MIESPCVKVCTLDAAGRICLGCFRTLEEIGGWPSMSDAQRRGILDVLPARRRDHEAAAVRPAGGG